MVLDIGAKSSNVLFSEDGKIFSRSINIGANAITRNLPLNKMEFPEAEQFKLEQGFVALGGAYEDPDNPQQAAISKIAAGHDAPAHSGQSDDSNYRLSAKERGTRTDVSGWWCFHTHLTRLNFAEKLNVG